MRELERRRPCDLSAAGGDLAPDDGCPADSALGGGPLLSIRIETLEKKVERLDAIEMKIENLLNLGSSAAPGGDPAIAALQSELNAYTEGILKRLLDLSNRVSDIEFFTPPIIDSDLQHFGKLAVSAPASAAVDNPTQLIANQFDDSCNPCDSCDADFLIRHWSNNCSTPYNEGLGKPKKPPFEPSPVWSD